VASGEVVATTSQAGGSGGGGEGGDTGYGNNLSFPLIFADSYGLTGLKISGTWPGVGPFTTLPTFDFNTGLRPLSTETLTAFPFFDSASAVSIATSPRVGLCALDDVGPHVRMRPCYTIEPVRTVAGGRA